MNSSSVDSRASSLHGLATSDGVKLEGDAPHRGGDNRRPSRAKKHQIGARITTETRDAIEREADRSGRSMSEVVEMWIEKGRFLQAYERVVLHHPDKEGGK